MSSEFSQLSGTSSAVEAHVYFSTVICQPALPCLRKSVTR